VQAARRLHRRRGRELEGGYLVEGREAVAEALAVAGLVRELFVQTEVSGLEALCARARATGVPVTRVSARVMGALSTTTTPQGAVAVANLPAGGLAQLDDADLVVVLAAVRDPGNAGTLVRSAAAVGADGVVFCRGAVDALQPKTVRAAAGALWRLSVVRGVAVRDCLEHLKMRGLRILGADAAAPRSIYDAELTRRLALVLGNESWGLRPQERALLDEVVSVPMERLESLNVGVAASVILFELARQRRVARGR
jgi:TrmH family RNA methyltransferase